MICPEKLAVLINTAAVSLAQSVTNEELDILAAVFTQLGDTLATISIQRSNIKACCEKKQIKGFFQIDSTTQEQK